MWLVRFVVNFCICYLPWPRVSKWSSHCGWVANLKIRVLDICFECFRVGSILWLPRGPYGWYIMGLNSHDIPVEIDIVATGTWFSLLHLYKCWWPKSKWTLILIFQTKSYLCSSKQGRWVVQVVQIRLSSLLNSMLYSNNDNALGIFWGRQHGSSERVPRVMYERLLALAAHGLAEVMSWFLIHMTYSACDCIVLLFSMWSYTRNDVTICHAVLSHVEPWRQNFQAINMWFWSSSSSLDLKAFVLTSVFNLMKWVQNEFKEEPDDLWEELSQDSGTWVPCANQRPEGHLSQFDPSPTWHPLFLTASSPTAPQIYTGTHKVLGSFVRRCPCMSQYMN